MKAARTLGILVAIAAGLVTPISLFALASLLVGGDGSRGGTLADALLMIVAPPLALVCGIGLARGARWGWNGLLLAAALLVIAGAAQALRVPTRTETRVDAGGVRVTTIGTPDPWASATPLWLGVGLLAALWLPPVRRAVRTDPAPSPADGWPRAQAADAPVRGVASNETGDPARDARARDARAQAAREAARGWRVGHRGRDAMFYEERSGIGWQRIEIPGEMLTGRAHHAVYPPTEEQWRAYPAWARDRRDEILARMRGEFRAPDYVWEAAVASGVPAHGPAAPLAASAAARSGKEGARALALVSLVLFAVAAGSTPLPVPRSGGREVLRAASPTLFWTVTALYAGVALASAAAAVASAIAWRRAR